MSVAVHRFNHLTQRLLDGTFDLDAGGYRVVLVSSAYTFSATHTVLANIGAAEIVGTGYVAGGAALANVVLSSAAGVAMWDADDVVWPAATLVCRRAIVYRSGTYNGLVDPMMFSILFNSAPADVSCTASDFTIRWAAGGILSV